MHCTNPSACLALKTSTRGFETRVLACSNRLLEIKLELCPKIGLDFQRNAWWHERGYEQSVHVSKGNEFGTRKKHGPRRAGAGPPARTIEGMIRAAATPEAAESFGERFGARRSSR